MKTSIWALGLGLLAGQANALVAGDIAFNSFNADEDGFSIVALANIDANTTIFFSDNEWNGLPVGAGGAFNSGESYEKWVSGPALISAGTVIRFTATDTTNLAASMGTLSRESVTGNTNFGLANSNETIYAYVGTAATTPATFLAAITNSDFGTADGTLTGTGLVQGTTALRLNANTPAATPDYGNYNGARNGQASYSAYLPLINNPANWIVDTTNGNYATTTPNIGAFSVTAVPEPESYLLSLVALGAIGAANRRKTSRSI